MANLTVNVETNYNGQGIRDARADLQALDRMTISQLQQRIKDLQKTLDNTRPNSAVFTRYATEVNRAKAALDALRESAIRNGSVAPSQIGSATTSVIEFNRVIQDAPYGIQGVGNNIQSLAQNFGYLVTTTGSARAALGAFFTSLTNPVNLAILAVSALTTAWTVYVRSQQGVKAATKTAADELRKYNGELDDFVSTLSAQDRVSARSAEGIAEETTKLRVLYGITQDSTFSLKQRNRAVDELQKLYPEYFKNQSNEAILLGNAATAYDTLTKAILASAKARAAIDISSENSKELVKIDLRHQDIDKRRNALLEQQKKTQSEIDSLAKKNADELSKTDDLSQKRTDPELISKQQQLVEINKDLSDLQDERTTDALKELKLKEDQFNLQKLINDQVKKGADITGKPGQDFKDKPEKAPPVDVIANSLQASSDNLDKEGLNTYKKQLETLSQEYEKYNRNIDKYQEAQAKKGVDVSQKAEDAKTVLALQYIDRRATIETTEADRVAKEVQRIRDESGANAEAGEQKDFDNLVKWRDAEIAKADGNAKILEAIDQASIKRRDDIRKEWFDRLSKQYDTLGDKVRAIEDQEFSQNKTGLSEDTKKIETELQKRIDKINELYDAMLKLNGGDIGGAAAIYGLRAASIAGVTTKAKTAENSTDYLAAKGLNQAVGEFTSKMYDSIASIGKKNSEITDKYNKAREGATTAEVARLNSLEKQEKALYNSFGSIFSGIFETFTESMNSLFKNTLTNLLKSTFQDGLKGLKIGGLSNGQSQALVAGAALAGNALSSINGGKNTLASAAGGALTGAASGAVIGSVVPGLGTAAGAIVGGVVGAVGGIFGSSKARKEEEIQKQQLEEQKKTNELIARQNALAYSSQVIGRMSENGVISSVDVNEFGQLTTTISGNDIVVSYDRTKKNQNRGT